MRQFYVYILASRSRSLYIGVTSNMARRLQEHRNGTASQHTARYRIHRLVHVESTGDSRAAIAREKQIKGWNRAKKIALIESQNPAWEDLSEAWLNNPDSGSRRR